VLNFQNVTKKFRNDFWEKSFYALDDVSFKINPGEITGFLGSNGAGKTTSIKIIMGFIKNDSGDIVFDKNLGTSRSDIFSNVGFFPERPFFYPHLTGREFVTYISTLNGLDRKTISQGIHHWTERMQIAHAIDRKIRGYSKGMLQRLGFATTLIKKPKLLILDEPLAGLDPIGRKEFKDVMIDLHKEGVTIFFSSHIVSDVEEICSKVVVLEKGRLLYDGRIDNLIENNAELSYQIKCKNVESFECNSKECVLTKTVGDIWLLEIVGSKKDEYLKKLLNKNIEIISFSPIRPNLEEIVYKIKK